MSDDDNKIHVIPEAKDILDGISTASEEVSANTEEKFLTEYQTSEIKSEIGYAHLKGIKDHYRHKGIWSWFLMSVIGVMLIYQCVLIVFVGLKMLDFEKYSWLMPALLVQNLAQVVGLAVWAVKHLFSNISNWADS